MTSVTSAEPRHIDAMAVLLEEMDQFYGATEQEPLDQRVRQINEALFGDVTAGHALLVWDGEQLVGLAAYSYLWPAAGYTRSLYLKELYVAKKHQRKGIGTLLMNALVDEATKHQCSRVEWTTDDENPGAQRFYASLDVPVDRSKLFYRMDLSTDTTGTA